MNVNEYVGIPYSLRPMPGFLNCWGCVGLIYNNELGEDIKSFSANTFRGISDAFTAAFAGGEHGFSVVDEPKDFDVAVFVNDQGLRLEYHCGVMYNSRVLHATNKYMQVVYQPLEEASEGFNRVEFWRR